MESLRYFPHEEVPADTYKGKGVDGNKLFLAGKATRYPNEVYADRIVYCRPQYCHLQIGAKCEVHVIRATCQTQTIYRLVPQFEITDVLPSHGYFGSWVLHPIDVISRQGILNRWKQADVKALLEYFLPGKTFRQFALDNPRLAIKVRQGHSGKLYALKKQGFLQYCCNTHIWKTVKIDA